MSRVTAVTWRDIAAVHRLEYPFPVNYACYAVWGACFATGGGAPLATLDVLAAVVANLLLIVAGLAVNTAADLRTDRRQRERSYLAGAARRVGPRRVVRLAGTEMAIALLLAGLVSARTGHWACAGSATLIIALHVLYNLEPARLKRRGLVGVTAFCAAVVVLPFLLSYQAVRPGLDPWVELVVVGLGLLAIGRMTWWSLPDRDADAATGMRTPSVRYGAARTLAVAGILMLTGLSLLTWGLWWRYGPVWVIPVAAAHGAFLYSALRERRPSSVRMRRTGMTLVMVGEVLLVAVPLLAG